MGGREISGGIDSCDHWRGSEVPSRGCPCKVSVGKKYGSGRGTGCKCIPEMPESYHESTGS